MGWVGSGGGGGGRPAAATLVVAAVPAVAVIVAVRGGSGGGWVVVVVVGGRGDGKVRTTLPCDKGRRNQLRAHEGAVRPSLAIVSLADSDRRPCHLACGGLSWRRT